MHTLACTLLALFGCHCIAFRIQNQNRIRSSSPEGFEWFWTIGERLPNITIRHHKDGEIHEDRQEVYDYVSVLENRSQWPERLKDCMIVAGPSKLRIMTRYIDGGTQGRVFSLGRDEFVVKFFKSEAEQAREFEVLQSLSQGVAGKSTYLMHLAPEAGQNNCCGVPCIVTEFVKGATLASILTSKRWDKNKSPANPLTEKFAKSVACQSLRAFRAMEVAGWKNCDQSLRNIMIDSDGNIKFIDFGLANKSNAWQPGCHWGGITSSRPQSLIDIAYSLSMDERQDFLEFANSLRKNSTAKEALVRAVKSGYLTSEDCNPVPPPKKIANTAVGILPESMSLRAGLHIVLVILIVMLWR